MNKTLQEMCFKNLMQHVTMTANTGDNHWISLFSKQLGPQMIGMHLCCYTEINKMKNQSSLILSQLQISSKV